MPRSASAGSLRWINLGRSRVTGQESGTVIERACPVPAADPRDFLSGDGSPFSRKGGEMVTKVSVRSGGPLASIAQVESWYDEHADCILALASRMLGDAKLAEAVVVEVFVVAYNTGGQWPRGSAGQRLVQLTHQRSGAILRQARRDQVPSGGEPVAATWPMSELPPDQRELTEAAFFEGYTAEELGARFHMPVRRAAEHLRDAMATMGHLVAAGEGTVPS